MATTSRFRKNLGRRGPCIRPHRLVLHKVWWALGLTFLTVKYVWNPPDVSEAILQTYSFSLSHRPTGVNQLSQPVPGFMLLILPLLALHPGIYCMESNFQACFLPPKFSGHWNSLRSQSITDALIAWLTLKETQGLWSNPARCLWHRRGQQRHQRKIVIFYLISAFTIGVTPVFDVSNTLATATLKTLDACSLRQQCTRTRDNCIKYVSL